MGYNERSFFMKKIVGLCILMSFLFGACVTAHQGIEADVIGFSDGVTPLYGDKKAAPRRISNPGGYAQMWADIMKVKADGANTSLIFAKDFARKRVGYVRRHYLHRDPDAKIYMIIMTDGLENTSLQASKNNFWYNPFGIYRTIESYQMAVKKKTSRAMGKRNAWQIYPIVFIGKDLSNIFSENNMTTAQQQDEFIQKQFEPIRGAKGAPLMGEDKVSPRVIASNDVNILAQRFKEEFTAASFGFHIPKGYVGQKVRMQLFSDESGDKMVAEFTGTYAKKGFGYVFKDVTFSKGLTCMQPSNGIWKSTNRKNGKSLISKFEISGFMLNGRAFIVDRVKQDVSKMNSGLWIWNSEYNAQVSRSENAYIIAILDGSGSVGDDHPKMKNALKGMIDIVTNRKSFQEDDDE
ncbi:MAG: hypothetical protein IJT61_03050 [Bacteroidales bacterium]|nr:hypothetical protein [Bacteroidales bacterium]